MFGVNSIALSLVLKLLDTFLVVDRNHIESKLLSSKGNLNLQNVEIKERNIRVRKRISRDTFLRLAGSVKGIDLSWDFGTSVLALTLRGLRLNLSFHDEYSNTTGAVAKGDGNENENDDSISALLREEWRGIKRGLAQNITQSKLLRDILDCLTWRLLEPRVSIKVPRAPDSFDNYSSFVSLGAESIEMSPEKAYVESNPFLRGRPIRVTLIMKSFFVNLIDRRKTPFPIVEPFSYTFTGRRYSGRRFLDLTTGYQLLGREHGGTTESSGYGEKYGLVVHVASERIKPITSIVRQFLGDSENKKGTPTKSTTKNDRRQFFREQGKRNVAFELMATPTDDKARSYPRYSMLYPLISTLVFGLLLTKMGFTFLLNISTETRSTASKQKGITAGLVSTMTVVAGIIGTASLFKHLVERYNAMFGFRFRKSTKKDETMEEAVGTATLRLPFPYASIVFQEGGTSITITKLAVLGRIHGTNITISGERLNMSSQASPMRISATGIRVSVMRSVPYVLMNIEKVNEILIPNRVRLMKPIEGAELRFEGGVVHANIKELAVHILQDKKTPRKSSDQKKSHRRWSSTAQPMDRRASKIGAVVRAEIRKEMEKLRDIAIVFEGISVERHRSTFRINEATFRGCDAVDFLMKQKIAANRHEAVRIGRRLQDTFNLFVDVTRDNKFKDDDSCFYRFVEVDRRRNWQEPLSVEPQNWLKEWNEHPLIPFSVIFDISKFKARSWQDTKDVFEAEKAEVLLTPGSCSRVLETVIYVDHLKASMLELWNGRLGYIIHPNLPKEIANFQLSMDNVQVSPGQSIDDWYDYFKPYHSQEDWFESFGFPKNDMAGMVAPTELTYFPFAYISPFKLKLRWEGIVLKPQLPSMAIQAFRGGENTSSSDLMQHFVLKVLKRTPGALAKAPREAVARVGGRAATAVKLAVDTTGVSELGPYMNTIAGSIDFGAITGPQDFDVSKIGEYITFPPVTKSTVGTKDDNTVLDGGVKTHKSHRRYRTCPTIQNVAALGTNIFSTKESKKDDTSTPSQAANGNRLKTRRRYFNSQPISLSTVTDDDTQLQDETNSDIIPEKEEKSSLVEKFRQHLDFSSSNGTFVKVEASNTSKSTDSEGNS